MAPSFSTAYDIPFRPLFDPVATASSESVTVLYVAHAFLRAVPALGWHSIWLLHTNLLARNFLNRRGEAH